MSNLRQIWLILALSISPGAIVLYIFSSSVEFAALRSIGFVTTILASVLWAKVISDSSAAAVRTQVEQEKRDSDAIATYRHDELTGLIMARRAHLAELSQTVREFRDQLTELKEEVSAIRIIGEASVVSALPRQHNRFDRQPN